MTTASLEDRVAALELQIAQLLLRRNGDERPKDWRRTIGMFAGDEIMREICENALEYREEDRRRTLAELDAEEGRSK
jgi:hypothetical protein